MCLCRKNIGNWLGSWFRMPFYIKPEILVTDSEPNERYHLELMAYEYFQILCWTNRKRFRTSLSCSSHGFLPCPSLIQTAMFLNMEKWCNWSRGYNDLCQKQKTTNNFSYTLQIADKSNVRILINMSEQKNRTPDFYWNHWWDYSKWFYFV